MKPRMIAPCARAPSRSAWHRRARWLLLTLLLAGAGWALICAGYAGRFSGPVSTHEQIPPGEAAMTQDIIQTAVRIVDQHKEQTRYLRDAHAKAHGCLRADVRVEDPLDAALRQGVFAIPGQQWQAWIRLSNGNAYPQFDAVHDARGMAIKLLDVAGAQLLPNARDTAGLPRREQDFVMFSHPNFFVSDVAEYRQNIAAQAEGKQILAFFPSWDPRSWQLRHLLIAKATLAAAPASPTLATYYSVSPYKLGEINVKFRVIADAARCPAYRLSAPNPDLPNFLRGALFQQLSADRQPACFALQVQRQDASRHMPIEDTSIEWRETDSAFETVARITVPPQDFDTPAQNLMCDNLSFNPWHGLIAHRPIGGINRLRRAVYEAVSAYRHARNETSAH